MATKKTNGKTDAGTAKILGELARMGRQLMDIQAQMDRIETRRLMGETIRRLDALKAERLASGKFPLDSSHEVVTVRRR